VTRRRLGRKAAEQDRACANRFEGATYPLSVVEIDHTKLDLMLVDDVDRVPIGRPWITLAFDVFSRMVTGFYISLDPVGAISTGLCIAHSMIRKEGWLQPLVSIRNGKDFLQIAATSYRRVFTYVR
jgi:putative transposase